ncbi:hypothetical protein VTO42DRAFT_4119 [Malbranchea cinnamomea]
MAPPPVPASQQTLSLLSTLHSQSLAQEAALPPSTFKDIRSKDEFDALMLDKFIALEQDKCAFVYTLLRAIDARTVVEAGTSFGVSTIYLALAVGQNVAAAKVGDARGNGKVIATEKEVEKAERAKGYWAQAGKEIESVIDLRVGDLRETLKEDLGVVDFLLLDIWTPLALPALQMVQPYMRPGALIVADNTVSSAEGYKELFEYVDREGSPFRRITLPYRGGLDLITYEPKT